jgi:hypothetical protein
VNPAHALHLAAVGFLVSVTTLGQVKPVSPSTGPASKNGTIKGRVVAADTELGLSKATITIFAQESNSEAEPRVVRTNENGDYEVTGLKGGRYTILAARSGYLNHFYGHRLPGGFLQGPGAPLQIREGETLSDINFRLVLAGAIEGRILDVSGEPMARATVQLSKFRNLGGRRRLVTERGARAETDDRGRFRLFEVPPGSYYLEARRHFALKVADGDRTAIPPTYYPGVLDPMEATRIEVGPGSEIQGVDVALLEVRGFSVSGRVVAQERLGREIYLMARRFGSDGNVGAYSTSGRSDRMGRFTIRNVIPGKYLITAQSDDSSPTAIQSGVLSGTRELEVTDTDVAEVTIPVGYGGEIDGRIEWPGDTSTLDTRKIRVEVAPEANFEGFYLAQGGGEVTRDLKFSFKGVSERRVRLSVLLPLGPHYVKSIRIEGREVVDQVLEIHNNDRLQVVASIAADGAEVAGIAKAEAGDAPVQGATILARARGDSRASARFRGRTLTDQEGRFSMRGLPPGNYLLAAFANLEFGGETDPEFVKVFEKTARHVELSPGQVLNETLKVIPVAPSQ